MESQGRVSWAVAHVSLQKKSSSNHGSRELDSRIRWFPEHGLSPLLNWQMKGLGWNPGSPGHVFH